MLRHLFLASMTAAAFAGISQPASALDDPTRAPYYEAFKGKTVAYLPITMAANITASWAAGVKRALEPLGVKFVIRDGNFKVTTQIQGDEVRVTGKSRDELQIVIAAVRAHEFPVPVQFVNFRD